MEPSTNRAGMIHAMRIFSGEKRRGRNPGGLETVEPRVLPGNAPSLSSR
jgi:hypothetical protein